MLDADVIMFFYCLLGAMQCFEKRLAASCCVDYAEFSLDWVFRETAVTGRYYLYEGPARYLQFETVCTIQQLS